MPWKKGESGNPGGRPRLAQGVRRKAQAVQDEAFDVLVSEMRGAEKSSERISAAVKVLQVAGVSMSEDKTPETPEQEKPLGGNASTEELMAAAAKGEA